MKATMSIPYFETTLQYIGEVVGVDGEYFLFKYKNISGKTSITHTLPKTLTFH